MKKLSFLFALVGLLVCGAGHAADITLYYSPYCPHCHHARDFFVNKMVYEYPDLRVVQINVMDEANLPAFQDALKKCEYDDGGVPVIVVGDKCFQGYADFMNQELRDAVEVDLSDADKKQAAENKKALEENPEDFKSKHSDRQNAITEYNVATAAAQAAMDEKKNSVASPVYFYALLIILVAALAFVLVRKDNKKKK